MILPKIRQELLQPGLTRPDWTKSSARDSTVLFLDKNENTDEAYIQFIRAKASEACLKDINHYPDCSSLYNKLSKELNITPHNLMLGAGSDGIIKYVFETFISRGDAVVYTDPTFAMYKVYSDLFGAKACRVGYEKKGNQIFLDLELFLKTIHDNQPRLVCLPNPDSPTGILIPEEHIIQIIDAAAKVEAVVLIDEAYYPFSEYTALPLINTYSNLILARTFSKAWGLAGARVGYAIANHELMIYMHKTRPMYEIGAVNAAIVLQALNYKDEMLASVQRLNAGKNYFKQEMDKLGFSTLSSAGNFQHVAFGPLASDIHKKLTNLVLYRQDFPGTVLNGYSRFSATNQNSFEKIVREIAGVYQMNLQVINTGVLSEKTN